VKAALAQGRAGTRLEERKARPALGEEQQAAGGARTRAGLVERRYCSANEPLGDAIDENCASRS